MDKRFYAAKGVGVLMSIMYECRGALYSVYGLRRLFPRVSFPAEPTQEDLTPLGVTIVEIPDPVPTLEELKERKREEILAARDAAVRDGTTWQGHPIWTDGDAQRLALSVMAAPTLAAAVGSAAPVPYPTWTCKDGHVVQLDEAYATDLCLTIQTYVTAMYNTAADLLTQVGAAQSAEDVAAVVWPENLG
ncbi:MAG: DUF4376 domain-containing protein [Pyramidobacter sp.]|uniref:DUF4376 domain-containing protein n=2 Tax=Pyramidobacter sp. TaxID=1943581 RepID=UPI0025DFEE0E|nr:DUF4376 domain-containing protein [Pyramidobacter sp.]MCI7403738.1 DUF4376 domain-containing protein [Pyramidobacter sp.]